MAMTIALAQAQNNDHQQQASIGDPMSPDNRPTGDGAAIVREKRTHWNRGYYNYGYRQPYYQTAR